MSEQSLHFLDYLVVAASLLVFVWVGLSFSKKQTSTSKYFAGGGAIPAWAVGMSILATLISSITFLAYPGEGFASNWIRLVQGLMVPIVLIFLILFVLAVNLKKLRGLNKTGFSV